MSPSTWTRPRRLLGVPALLLVLLASSATAFFTQDKCPTINQKPDTAVVQHDLCSLCHKMVVNSYLWNWRDDHLSALCAGVPPYMMDWCEFFACKLSSCADFQEGACRVQSNPHTSMKNSVQMNSQNAIVVRPCPAKYMCFYCLRELFENQIAGCFDNLYANV